MEKTQEGKFEGGRGEKMLVLEFCTIKKWTTEALLKLHRDYFIGHELDGEPKGIAGLSVCAPENRSFPGGRGPGRIGTLVLGEDGSRG